MRRWRRSVKSGCAPTAELDTIGFTKEQSSLCSFFASVLNREPKQKTLTAEDAEDSQRAPRLTLILVLETVTSSALHSHGFGHFQKCRRGVRQIRVFAIDQAQFALQLQFTHRDSDQ